MPSNFKKRVRERRQKTGESWQTASRHVRAEGLREPVGDPEPVEAGGAREDGSVDDDASGLGDALDRAASAPDPANDSGLWDHGREGDDGGRMSKDVGYAGDDFETEECSTLAEAMSEAERFARAQSRQGYEVSILDGEPGLVSVWVRRAVPSSEVDFAEDDKRFTFPIGEDDPGDGSFDPPDPTKVGVAGPAPIRASG